MKCEEKKISITSFIDAEENITSLKRPEVLPCGDTRGRSNQLLLDIKKIRLMMDLFFVMAQILKIIYFGEQIWSY